MRLYLVRHAIAFDRDPEQWPDDALRPLTPQGIRRFRRAARGVGGVAGPVDVLLTSPFARAHATAEILTDVAGWPAARPCDALRGGATAEESVAALAGYADRDSVAAVGHEPDLHELMSYLLAGNTTVVASLWRKGAVAALDLPGGPVPGSAVLLWHIQPGELRALGD